MRKTQKLVSRRNTKRVRDLVIYAAEQAFNTRTNKVHEVAFSAGRWTVIVRTPTDDLFYVALDAEPGIKNTGLHFQRVP